MTPARRHLLQALARRRLAKRYGLTASLSGISEAHWAIEQTTRCAVWKLEEYREMRFRQINQSRTEYRA